MSPITPEDRARLEIDQQLQACCWVVQDFADLNISVGLGVAVREFPLKSGEAVWLKDKSLEDSEDLPDPAILAQEIADDLQTALDQFQSIAAELKD